jgi:hypothetical protein
MFLDVGNPEFVRGKPVELAMNEVIGGRNAVQALHLRRTLEPGDPGMAHQDSDEALADPNAHPEG